MYFMSSKKMGNRLIFRKISPKLRKGRENTLSFRPVPGVCKSGFAATLLPGLNQKCQKTISGLSRSFRKYCDIFCQFHTPTSKRLREAKSKARSPKSKTNSNGQNSKRGNLAILKKSPHLWKMSRFRLFQSTDLCNHAAKKRTVRRFRTFVKLVRKSSAAAPFSGASRVVLRIILFEFWICFAFWIYFFPDCKIEFLQMWNPHRGFINREKRH